jgi:hypothetical protein
VGPTHLRVMHLLVKNNVCKVGWKLTQFQRLLFAFNLTTFLLRFVWSIQLTLVNLVSFARAGQLRSSVAFGMKQMVGTPR